MFRCLFVFPALARFALVAVFALPAPARAGEADDVYRKAAPSLVWIRNHIGNTVSEGSGFVADAGRGLIVTNHHVAQRERTVDVFFPAPDGKGGHIARRNYYTDNVQALQKAGYYAVGYLSAYDPALDLAVFEVRKTPAGARALALADREPKDTDRLHMLGNPAGRDLWRYAPGIDPQATRVRTSAKNGEDAYDYKALSMASSPFPGNSGGPVVNAAGDVVGVLSRGGGEGGKVAVAVHRDELAGLLKTVQRHAVFSVENPGTGRIVYQVKWNDGEWANHTIEPGTVRTHWHATANETTPYVRFDSSSAPGFQEKAYKVTTFVAYIGKNVQPNAQDHAKEHVFRWSGTNLDLYTK